MEVILAIFFIILVVLLIRPVLILVHELGHAFYALKYTKKEVDILIGGHTDESNSYVFKRNNLTIYVKKNPLYWFLGGCCICEDEEMNTNEYISFCLGGVAFELLFTSLIFFPCYYFDTHGALRLITGLMFGYSIIDVLANLYPRVISKGDFVTLYSDGFLIWKAFKGENANREAIQKFSDYYRNRDRF